MRTTIDFPEELLRALRARAAEGGISLSALVTDAAKSMLLRETAPSYRVAPIIPVSLVSGGLQPGVDLDDSSALFDRMDGLSP
jgi:plasmid stability protein